MPKANTTYNDIFSMSMAGTANGTLTNVVVSNYQTSYTINGIAKNVIDMWMNVDVIMGSDIQYMSDADFNMDGSFGLGFGTAISVRRTSDGAGAKFVISYAANYAKNDIAMDDEEDAAALETELTNYLNSNTATLKVYDDSNALIYQTTLTGEKAYELSLFEGVD